MTRLLPLLLAALLLVPAATAAARDLPRAHPVDLSGVTAPDRLTDLGAEPRLPAHLKRWIDVDGARAADHWEGVPVVEQRFEDQHGHILTLATDNPNVDLRPFANLLASTYHYDEIEFVHAFVTDGATLTQICGATAAACYGADDPDSSPAGVMIVSYEDPDVEHAVIHEYGHHVDNNTYNLGGLSDCGIDGDGSRRWFFAREMEDRILDQLSCDPRPGWGQLLPEVFAEDYAQMAGIPESEYHPAIRVPPPTTRQKRALREDLDSPFGPASRRVSGRASRRGRAVRRFTFSVPVFIEARRTRGVRSVRVRGCSYENFRDVFAGTCRVVVRAKRPGGRFSFRLVAF